MGLNVRIYDIVSDGPYSIRYKSGANPYPEYDNTTFTLYGTGLTATTIELTGLTFDTQYWIKMTDETTGRYIVKNIYTHDSKAFPCYDTICFSVDVECNVEPVATNTPTPTVTSTSTPTLTSTPTPTMSCQVPTINSVTLLSGTTFQVTFTAGGNCSATQIEYSNDNVNWTTNAGGCTSPREVDPGSSSGTWYFRMKQFCLNSTSSVYSNTVSVSSSTATPTPTPTLTRTPTPTGTCAYKQWTIGQCTIGTCNLGICQCQGTTAITVYTQCSVTDLLDEGTAIYSTSSLISPFTGDFTYQAGSNPYIYNSSGSGVTLVCSLGNGC